MLSPEEKIKELIEKFKPHIKVFTDHYGNEDKTKTNMAAKQCALILCDEMLDEHDFKFTIKWNITRTTYWQQVKDYLNQKQSSKQ